ncbi:MAG: hypothetical protein MJE77_19470 [Proteobacteria bacterium]|nr:hypothetical protein [Pseudomonadota bacterium]
MTIRNPGFEDAGDTPGQAQHWTLVTFTGRQRIAGFGPIPHQAGEDFERWVPLKRNFATGELVFALFDVVAEGYEDFEDGFRNDRFLTELPTGRIVTAPFGDSAVETLEYGWQNAPYATSWHQVIAVTALFDAGPVESFEARWRHNESYAWSFGAVLSATAVFGAEAGPVEHFEMAWTEATTI